MQHIPDADRAVRRQHAGTKSPRRLAGCQWSICFCHQRRRRRNRGARASFEIVKNSESVGYSMVDGKVTLVYRVIIQNTAIPGSRPQEIILPLVQADKKKAE